MESHSNTKKKVRTSVKPSPRIINDKVKSYACKTWHKGSCVGFQLFIGEGGRYTVKYIPRADHNKISGIER